MSHSRFAGRTLARSQALQLLFQAEEAGRSVAVVLDDDYLLSDGPLDPYGQELALGTGAMVPELDAIIGSASQNWSVSRMPAVDRCLLRVSVYEMLESDDVAPAVTIDESVELAKAFGTDESPRFVNGVLGNIAQRIEAGEDLLGFARERLAAAEEPEPEPEPESEPEPEPADEDGAAPEPDDEPEPETEPIGEED